MIDDTIVFSLADTLSADIESFLYCIDAAVSALYCRCIIVLMLYWPPSITVFAAFDIFIDFDATDFHYFLQRFSDD